MDTQREAIDFLNGMRDQFIELNKNKSSSDLKIISAIGLVCGMAEESLIQGDRIESLKCCGNCLITEKPIKNLDCISCKRLGVEEENNVDNWKPKKNMKGYNYLNDTLDYVRSKTFPPCLDGKSVKEFQEEFNIKN